MKARRLKDNEIVDVIRYEKPINRDEVYVDGKLRLYLPSDLDFDVEEAEQPKDEFAARMQGKFTEQDLSDAKQRTESCMASIPSFELPKPIESQIDEAMAGIASEAKRQYGDFGANNADITIPIYKQMMRLGALVALASQWVNVEDRLPEIGNNVLVYVPSTEFRIGGFEVAYFDGEDWYTTDGEHVRPTHWLLIPALPTKGGEE